MYNVVHTYSAYIIARKAVMYFWSLCSIFWLCYKFKIFYWPNIDAYLSKYNYFRCVSKRVLKSYTPPLTIIMTLTYLICRSLNVVYNYVRMLLLQVSMYYSINYIIVWMVGLTQSNFKNASTSIVAVVTLQFTCSYCYLFTFTLYLRTIACKFYVTSKKPTNIIRHIFQS